MEDRNLASGKKWLETVSKGRRGYEIEKLGNQDFQITLAERGWIRGTFVVPKNCADKDGNWHSGAIAILVDNVGSATIVSYGGKVKASINFDLSYLSTVKVQEEVEVEAKVLNTKEKLCEVVVEIRRKENGEKVVFGKHWMLFFDDKEKKSSKL